MIQCTPEYENFIQLETLFVLGEKIAKYNHKIVNGMKLMSAKGTFRQMKIFVRLYKRFIYTTRKQRICSIWRRGLFLKPVCSCNHSSHLINHHVITLECG